MESFDFVKTSPFNEIIFDEHGRIISFALVCEMSKSSQFTAPSLRNKYVHYHNASALQLCNTKLHQLHRILKDQRDLAVNGRNDCLQCDMLRNVALKLT